MADIDKGLPGNTRTEIKMPSEEEMAEVSVQEEVTEQGPVEVTPEEDGGATINFEPGAINIPGTEGHFDNLQLEAENDPMGTYDYDQRYAKGGLANLMKKYYD